MKKSTSIRMHPMSVILIITGFACILFPTFYRTVAEQPASQPRAVQNTQPTVVPTITPSLDDVEGFGPVKIDAKLTLQTESPQYPRRIVIPTLALDLSIVEAPVVKGYWETSKNTASHGIGSAYPGEVGNIVIFAHARPGLFEPLKDIKKGTDIYLLSDTQWFGYSVTDIKSVLPTDTATVAATSTEILTLFTCSGFLDSQRFIVTAKPIVN